MKKTIVIGLLAVLGCAAASRKASSSAVPAGQDMEKGLAPEGIKDVPQPRGQKRAEGVLHVLSV